MDKIQPSWTFYCIPQSVCMYYLTPSTILANVFLSNMIICPWTTVLIYSWKIDYFWLIIEFLLISWYSFLLIVFHKFTKMVHIWFLSDYCFQCLIYILTLGLDYCQLILKLIGLSWAWEILKFKSQPPTQPLDHLSNNFSEHNWDFDEHSRQSWLCRIKYKSR